MNNRRLLYYPAVIYVAILLCVWLLSWVMGAVTLLRGSGAEVAPLVSAEGVRWAVRSASATIDNAPWAAIMLFVTSAGLLWGSGMARSARAFLHEGSLSFVERRAWVSALVALLLYVLLLFLCTLSPWNLLLGVTGNILTSPLMQGRVILAFAGLLFVTSVYGFMYGNYRSVVDVACSVGEAFSLFAPAFVAVLPATGIIPCAWYVGVLDLFGVTPQGAAVAADVVYFLPFLYTLYFSYREWKKSR